MSAPPSLANNADTNAPRIITYTNISLPFPRARDAICNAAHSKNPTSSSNKEIMMIATKANVAFHTILVTSATSVKLTTPVNKASAAPPIAGHPIPSPFGCQITKNKVSKKINIAT
ncbi:hypothetical protein D3C78_1107970 [compost metagenome]